MNKKSYFIGVIIFWNIFVVAQQTIKKPLLTTTIGAFPKPSYVVIPDWFKENHTHPSISYDEYLKTAKEIETLDRATQEVVLKQINLGIDIPTDGEIRRENYVYYHCRHLDGIEFSLLTNKVMRDSTWQADVPTIVGPIKQKEHFLARDFKVAQAVTKQPIKITIPGPMTIVDSLADVFYYDEEQLGAILAQEINNEVLALVEAGCTWIQIDEPVFARYPEKALVYGIKHLERCFENVPDSVMSVVHICCGYPSKVDLDYYPKADQQVYHDLAHRLDTSCVKVISLEDAHRRNDLSLFEHFKNTIIILGVIDIAQTRIESVEEIKEHILGALDHIDAERLMIAPDCGLGFLPVEVIEAKLSHMVQATCQIRELLNEI